MTIEEKQWLRDALEALLWNLMNEDLEQGELHAPPELIRLLIDDRAWD